MNKFLEAAKNSNKSGGKDEDASKERYNELKKEEADVNPQTPAEQRYNELKDKAKKRSIEEEHSGSDEDEEDAEEEFITH